MKKIRWKDTKSVEEIVHLLQLGSIIGGTSDTVIGLLAPLTQSGFEMLNSIKGRIDKPYIVLVSCTEKAIKFSADFKKPFVQLLVQHYWPGPLTMIVKAHANMPTYLRSKDGTIAIRVPSHKKLQKVLEHFDGLFSTSANKAGEPIPHKVTLIDPSIKKYLALLVEEEKNQQIPSTIIDVTGEAPRLVRQGVLRLEK